MAIDPSGLVAPAAAPAPPAAPQAALGSPMVTPSASGAPPAAIPDETPTKTLPPALLKIHAMQALIAGNPAAVSAPLKDFGNREEAKIIRKHKDALTDAGFGFYRSLSGDLGVLFNSLHIHPQDLIAADKAGKLQQIAPSWDVVSHAVSKAGIHHPALKATGVPNGLATPTLQAPPQATAAMGSGESPVPAAPSSVQRKAMAARIGNIQPGAPTSGPFPGAGRILNQIYKPVV